MTNIYNQYDSRWANQRIGNSSLTLGRQGCAVCAMCTALGKFGITILPSEMAKHSDWFNPHGLIIWNKVQEGLKKIYSYKSFSIYRYYGRNDKAIQQNLKPGSAVLLQVANASHWMVAERKQWLRNEYNCSDPWGGVSRATAGDYKNITGYVIIKIT